MNRTGVVLVLAAVVLTGCGDTEYAEDVPTTSTAGSRLTVTVHDDADTPPRVWDLTCDPAGGDHPDPEAACSALSSADDPFAPVPTDAMCAEIYGGPQTATLEGVWRGREVRASYNRVNACEIARWDAVAPVLQTPTAT